VDAAQIPPGGGPPRGRVAGTGGAGVIGSPTRRARHDARARVLILDDMRHHSPLPIPSEAEVAEVDVADEAARRAIARFKPDAILHLAAQGGVNRSWRDPAADAANNVIATISVLEAALEAGSRVVFASSGGALYGDTDVLPTPEGTRTAPRSPYGSSKAACEVYLRMFARSRGLRFVALRYSNVYGPGQDGTGEAGVVAISSERLAQGLAPRLRGDGLQTRDFVFVEDVAAANLLALGSVTTGSLNIGTGVETPVRRVIEALAEQAQFHGSFDLEPAPSGEVRRSALDAQRALEQLGWSARTDLLSGLRRTYEHFRSVSGSTAPAMTDTQTTASRVYSHDATAPSTNSKVHT